MSRGSWVALVCNWVCYILCFLSHKYPYISGFLHPPSAYQVTKVWEHVDPACLHKESHRGTVMYYVMVGIPSPIPVVEDLRKGLLTANWLSSQLLLLPSVADKYALTRLWSKRLCPWGTMEYHTHTAQTIRLKELIILLFSIQHLWKTWGRNCRNTVALF